MNTRNSQQKNVLRLCLILLAVIIAPAWAQNKQDKKDDSEAKPAKQERSAQAPRHSKPQTQQPSGNGGTRPSGGGTGSNGGSRQGGSNAGGKPATSNPGNPPKSAGDRSRPSGGNSATPPQNGGNRPSGSTSGGGRPSSTSPSNQPPTTGGNKSQGGGRPSSTSPSNQPATAGGNKSQGGGNRQPSSTTGENRQSPSNGNRSASTTGGNKSSNGGNRSTTNVKPFSPPQGATAKPNTRGGTTYVAKNGTQFNTAKTGNLTTVTTKNGTVARYNNSGRVTTINSGRIVINQNPHGGRVVVARLPSGGRVVSVGRYGGYVQHPYNRGGVAYVNRTYIYGGRTTVVVYRGYHWHGHPYYRYVPPYYYRPPFYGWAYRPWGAPVHWGWGWGGSPWYGYYGYYFAPYPVYPSAAFWLTDYLIAANLQAAYAAQAAANANAQAQAYAAPPPAPDQNAVTLTPEVKQAIADEVSAQLAAQQSAAAAPASAAPSATPSSGGDQMPDALDPKSRTFIVSTTLSQTMADGSACSLSSGDVLTRIGNTPDANQNVTVMVTSSQNGDCPTGTQMPMAVDDLQDMRNDFRQKLDSGMQSLADNQGKDGMPAAPSVDKTPVPDGTADPEPDAAAQLAQTDQSADQAEAEVQQSQGDDGNN